MAAPDKTLKCSKNSLFKTIESDTEASDWFYLLLNNPEFAARAKAAPAVNGLTGRARRNKTLQAALSLLQIAALIRLYFTENPADLLVFILLFYAGYKLRAINSAVIAEISRTVTDKDFTEHGFAGLTFLQICEFYAAKYGIPSFADATFAAETILRRVLVLIFTVNSLLFVFIFELSPFKFLLASIIPYLMFSFILSRPRNIYLLDKYFKLG